MLADFLTKHVPKVTLELLMKNAGMKNAENYNEEGVLKYKRKLANLAKATCATGSKREQIKQQTTCKGITNREIDCSQINQSCAEWTN